MKIVLYSNHCPCCDLLECALKEAGFAFEHVSDIQSMLDKGFTSVPVLEVDDQTMNFPAALKWLKERMEAHAYQQV